MAKYRIMMGGVLIDTVWLTGLTYDEAYQICEDKGWVLDEDDGFIYDLYIEAEEA